MRLKKTLFVSDLHLDEARPESTAQFERFLGATAPGADALYILGDLFEYWVGDDGLAFPFNARVASLLKTGVPTYFMWKLWPSAVTMPAASWPRCWSTVMPS